jgi:hypothetical protein
LWFQEGGRMTKRTRDEWHEVKLFLRTQDGVLRPETAFCRAPAPYLHAIRTRDYSGRVALALCLGGVILAALIGQRALPAYLLFLSFQIVALTLGIVAWRTPLGKAAAIAASVLTVGSFALVA